MYVYVFHRCVFCCRGVDMLCGLEAILELYYLEALLKLCLGGGIIHIKGVTIGVIIGGAALIIIIVRVVGIIVINIIIIIIHNVGMCGSIPNRNWTVVMVVIELILIYIVCHPTQGGVRQHERMLVWICVCVCYSSSVVVGH